jgi:hypothetical protein
VARAPPSGDGEPDLIEFGIPVLDDRLEEAEVTFPADRGELRTSVGELEIPFDAAGHTLRVADALDQLDVDRFETKTQLLDALHHMCNVTEILEPPSDHPVPHAVSVGIEVGHVVIGIHVLLVL